MFDVGFSELLLIAVVALVVLGPERLPKAARFAGLWVRRARRQWDSVKQELERELEAEDLKRSLQDVQRSVQQAGDGLREQARQVQAAADTLQRDVARTPEADAAASAVDPGDAPAEPAPSAEAGPAPSGTGQTPEPPR
ncbi:Sec-independent protein translocase protein TatB [Stenotrophomonas mori]|uniref:Sec-independent protein translocase protein TatB n=1 Tax=Stenotrophomonas mori TaxID=2871096 RepID=A0ABT0SI27_9GAMM|nr:Sec-independent protein translocase protein TatB [Stenotrophomonas mori]